MGLLAAERACDDPGMDYRDERDALRARVESLEGSLSTAQADLERMRATEQALEASKREIQRLKAELDRLRPKQPGDDQTGRLRLIIGVGAVVMIAAFGTAYSLRGGVKPAPSNEPVSAPQIPVQKPEPPPEPPTPQPAPAPAQPAKPVRTAHAEWSATVKSSQGAGPAAGTACTIVAELQGDGEDAGVQDLEVVCGSKFLYRSTDPINGMSTRSSGADEVAGKSPGTLRYTVMLEDQGTRSGRAQISLDSKQRTAVVWTENVPTYRVELAVEAESLPRTGDPLIDEANRVERLAATVLRTGSVAKLEGNPGVAAGAQCSVDVSPVAAGAQNCRVRVRCGGKLLYGDGTTGYNKCAIREGRLGRLSDPRPSSQDHDPELEMDLSENTVVVGDDADPPWKVSVALTPAPR